MEASTARAASQAADPPASTTAGSRFPCSARPGPTRRRAASMGTRKSTPTTSGPQAAIWSRISPVPTPKWILGTPVAPSASSTRAECGATPRRYWSGDRAPAQLSNSCTAAAPASTWASSEAMARSARRSISSCHSPSSPTMSDLVRSWWRDGPPSTRYDATVNGAPANPMRGTSSISTARRTVSIT